MSQTVVAGTDLTVIIPMLGMFLAAFLNGLSNGTKLTDLGKSTNYVKDATDRAIEQATIERRANTKKMEEVEISIQAVKVEVEARMKDLMADKERAARMEALMEARLESVERNSTAWLAALVEAANAAIVAEDLDGTIVSWNPAAEVLFGYSKDDVVGSPMMNLVPTGSEADERRLMERARLGMTSDLTSCRRKRKDGTIIEVELVMSPMITPDGKTKGLCSVYRSKWNPDDRATILDKPPSGG